MRHALDTVSALTPYRSHRSRCAVAVLGGSAPASSARHAGQAWRTQIPARRWLGLTATPYRRDKLDDLIVRQVGPVRHTISHRANASDGHGTGRAQLDLPPAGTVSRPAPALRVHPAEFCYTSDADPSAPGGIAAIYRDLTADNVRTAQVTKDVCEALARGRHCLGSSVHIPACHCRTGCGRATPGCLLPGYPRRRPARSGCESNVPA